MAYRNNSNKFWTGFLAVLLVLVLAGAAALVGVLSDGFKNWDKFQPDEEQTEETVDGGSPVTDENGNELESNEAIPMPKSMTFRSATSLDGTNAAYDSVMLTATIKPDNADNKAVDWSVAFVNPSSEWATGKTVTDYVTVTPNSDGALTATVNCLQAFGEQISITVTSRENEEATASCIVDFAKRILSFAGGIGTENMVNTPVAPQFSTDSDTCVFGTSIMGGLSAQCFPRVNTAKTKYSAYTVEDSFTFNFSLRLTDEYYSLLKSGAASTSAVGSMPQSPAEIVIENGEYVGGQSYGLGTYSCFFISGALTYSVPGFFQTELTNVAVGILKENSDMVFMTMTAEAVGTYSTFTKIIQFKANASQLVFAVESISLNQSNVII